MESHPVDVFFVGSSHIYAGIDPSAFPMRVVNLAESGLNYQVAEVLIDRYWEHVSKAQAVVIEFDAVPLYKDTIAFREGDLSDLWDWDLSPSVLSLSVWQRSIAYIDCEAGMRRFPPIHHPARPAKKIIGPGFEPSPSTLNGSSTGAKTAFFQSLGTKFSPEIVQRNIQALGKIRERLKEANVVLILFRPPFHQDYWSNVAGRDRAAFTDRELSDLMQNSPDEKVIDFRTLSNLPDAFFSDFTHLSNAGAAAVSKQVAEQVAVMSIQGN